MSSPLSPDVNAMNVDQAAIREPGEVTPHLADTPPHGRPARGGRGRRRNWRRGGGHPRPRHEDNSNAMGAFTRFFKAEAQASESRRMRAPRPPTHFVRRHPLEELATRKEAHAFAQLVRAEREADALRIRARGRHLSLDNRPHRQDHPFRGPNQRPHSSGHASTPRHQTRSHQHQTAAQLIAQVASNTVANDAPPAVMLPTPIDQGPDVSEIIAAAEQLDLEQAARQPSLP
ncbi:hypothetical protein CY34DRAFT_814556, partial [Suillus luteus UH-Slu-Lm8-n1]